MVGFISAILGLLKDFGESVFTLCQFSSFSFALISLSQLNRLYFNSVKMKKREREEKKKKMKKRTRNDNPLISLENY